MAKTRAQLNRAVRQEALREQLAAGGHVEHVIDISKKLADPELDLDRDQITRLKAAADIKIALIKKYLPDLKQTEMTVEHSGSIDQVSDEQLDKRIEALMDACSQEK